MEKALLPKLAVSARASAMPQSYFSFPSHQSKPTHVAEMTDDEEEIAEALALANSIVRPANTGARAIRPKPSDPKIRYDRDLLRQHGWA
jgi:hypothetical protein